MINKNKIRIEIRPDVRERVVRIRAREAEAHADHVAFIQRLVLRNLPEEQDWVTHAQARRDEAREP